MVNYDFLFCLVSTVCTLHQRLLDWHIPLLAIGPCFLVAGGAVAILIIVYKCWSEFYVSCTVIIAENNGKRSVKFGPFIKCTYTYILWYIAVP